MPTMNRGPRVRNVVSRMVDGAAMVIPVERDARHKDSVYTLNEAGSRLWAMIEAGRKATELAGWLEAEYGLSADDAAADTEQFLTALADEGLIELA